MKVLVVDSYWKKVYFINRRGKSIDELMVCKAAFFSLAGKVQMDLNLKNRKTLQEPFNM